MNTMVDIKTVFIVIALIALIVLIVYAIFMVKKLMITLDRTNVILEDVEVISSIASERAQDVDGIITDVSVSVSEISGALKGNSSVISSVAGLAKSAVALKTAFSKEEKSKEEK
ncbi:MAG: hypothetical protein HUJ79_06435 [Firmicutes bacterium]|nr:hypothetical protein [Bacillota bacterium]